MTVADLRPAEELSSLLAPYLPLLAALRRGAPLHPNRTSLVEAAAAAVAGGAGAEVRASCHDRQ